MHQHPREERHEQALARTLRMPNHPRLAVALQRLQHLLQSLLRGVVLMVARCLLDHRAPVILKDREIPQQVEEHVPAEQAAHQGFPCHFTLRIDQRFPIHRAPCHVPVKVRREGAVAGGKAIAQHAHQVRAEERRDVRLVSLNLVIGGNNVRVFRLRPFQFHDHQRQAVEENQNVRPPLVRAHHRELIHRQPLVVLVLPIDQPRPVMDGLTAALVFHRHAIHEQSMNPLVLLDEFREAQIQQGIRRRRHRFRREIGIDPRYRRLQPPR